MVEARHKKDKPLKIIDFLIEISPLRTLLLNSIKTTSNS